MSSYPLRLPDHLNERARERAGQIGISFNAVICVAVEAYLRGGQSASVGHPPPFVPDDDFEVLVNAVEHAPDWATADPKPELPPKPTKRQRRALAEWHNRQGGS